MIYRNWQDFVKIVDMLASTIKSHGNHTIITAPPRGGLPIAICLSHKLQIPYINIESINKQSNILLIDDIADTGRTVARLNFKWKTFATWFYCERSIIVPNIFFETTKEWVVFPWEQ